MATTYPTENPAETTLDLWRQQIKSQASKKVQWKRRQKKEEEEGWKEEAH